MPHLCGQKSALCNTRSFWQNLRAYRLLKRMVCDSARTSVTPALISMVMMSVMKVFLMMKTETEGEMLSEEKAQQVAGKWVAQCRVNTGHKQRAQRQMLMGRAWGWSAILYAMSSSVRQRSRVRGTENFLFNLQTGCGRAASPPTFRSFLRLVTALSLHTFVKPESRVRGVLLLASRRYQ